MMLRVSACRALVMGRKSQCFVGVIAVSNLEKSARTDQWMAEKKAGLGGVPRMPGRKD